MCCCEETLQSAYGAGCVGATVDSGSCTVTIYVPTDKPEAFEGNVVLSTDVPWDVSAPIPVHAHAVE